MPDMINNEFIEEEVYDEEGGISSKGAIGIGAGAALLLGGLGVWAKKKGLFGKVKGFFSKDSAETSAEEKTEEE